MKVKLANDSIKEIWGKGNDIEGKSLLEIIPELKEGQVPKILKKVYATGIPFEVYEVLIPLMRNNKLEDVYFNYVYQPYLETDKSI